MDSITYPTRLSLSETLLLAERNRRRALRETLASTAPQPFGEWLPEWTPEYTWTWPHLVHCRETLDRITSGEIRKAMFFLPPRHGKTEQNTVRYLVYRLHRNPALRGILAAYNQTLAEKFSRKARRLAERCVSISSERRAAYDWETTAMGGVRAVGVGAGITGTGADLVLIDDPVKSREEADSEAYRERCWEWYQNDLYTRLEPGAAMILTMTRWHQDDLAGRILGSDDAANWTVVSLPAIAEENDPLGRTLGQALCPERYDETALESIRVSISGRAFDALFQQRPRPKEGAMFKWDWFRLVDAIPAQADRVRYWDTAGSDGKGDFTVGARLSRTRDGRFWVEDVVRGQWSIARRNAIIRETAERDGAGVRVWVEAEAGIGGEERNKDLAKSLAGFSVRMERPTGDKAVRAEPFAAQAEAGNVSIVRGPWLNPYLNELCDFPFGAHDDQVDASSGAFNKLAIRTTGRIIQVPA